MAFAAIQLVMALAVYVSWERESSVIRQQALQTAKGLRSDAERILAVNNWVYNNKGFEKNSSYFLLPQVGPTPIQVIESGGNCSDKSRLVAAMLKELGIRAGLVMLSPCAGCTPIHTVVEAVYENGRMVVDPTWDMHYPKDDNKFLGVAELAGNNRGRQHLLQLQQEGDPYVNAIEKIQLMPEAEATFDFAKSINWDRNWATRTGFAVLQAAGFAPEKIMRPSLAEDPKLIISAALLIGGLGCILAIILCYVCITIPNGGSLVMEGNTIENGPKSSNSSAAVGVIGAEGVLHQTLELRTFDPARRFRNLTATPAVLTGNSFSGKVELLFGNGVDTPNSVSGGTTGTA